MLRPLDASERADCSLAPGLCDPKNARSSDLCAAPTSHAWSGTRALRILILDGDVIVAVVSAAGNLYRLARPVPRRAIAAPPSSFTSLEPGERLPEGLPV